MHVLGALTFIFSAMTDSRQTLFGQEKMGKSDFDSAWIPEDHGLHTYESPREDGYKLRWTPRNEGDGTPSSSSESRGKRPVSSLTCVGAGGGKGAASSSSSSSYTIMRPDWTEDLGSDCDEHVQRKRSKKDQAAAMDDGAAEARYRLVLAWCEQQRRVEGDAEKWREAEPVLEQFRSQYGQVCNGVKDLFDKMHKNINERKQTCNDLRKQRNTIHKVLKDNQKELDTLEDKHYELKIQKEQACDDLRKQLDTIQTDMQALQKEHDTLKEEHKALHTAHQLKIQNEQLVIAKNDQIKIEDKTKELEADRDGWKRRYEELMTKHAKLQEEMHDVIRMQEELARAKRGYQEAKKIHTELRKELQKITDDRQMRLGSPPHDDVSMQLSEKMARQEQEYKESKRKHAELKRILASLGSQPDTAPRGGVPTQRSSPAGPRIELSRL